MASIRKIIADEDTPLRAAMQPVAPPPTAPRLRELEEPRPAAVVTPITPAVAAPRPANPPVFGLPRAAFGANAAIPREPALPPRESATPVKAEAQAAESAPAAPESIEPVASVAPLDPAPRPAEVAPEPEPLPLDTGALVSEQTTDSIASAFQTLTTSVALTSRDTVDRHVREMLRPMLRTWLDDNLPVIVEKLVRAEIERVARGGQ